MSSDDDYHDAFDTQDPLPPGSTGTPAPNPSFPFRSLVSPIQATSDGSLYRQTPDDDSSFLRASDTMDREVSRGDALALLESTLPSDKLARIPMLLDKYEGKYEQLVRLAEFKYGAPQHGDTLDGSVIRENNEPSVIHVDDLNNTILYDSDDRPYVQYALTDLGIVPLVSEPNRKMARILMNAPANVFGAVAEVGAAVGEIVEEGRYVFNAAKAVYKVARPIVAGVVAGAKANAAQPRLGMIPIDPALVDNLSPPTQVVAPLVQATTGAVGALGRTASKALAGLPPAVDIRGEDDNPTNVIGVTKETSGDMPPKRTSSMRPDVAKRELEQIVRSSSLTPTEKTGMLAEVDEAVAKLTRQGDDPQKLVDRVRRQLSSAVSAPDEPDATPWKAAPTTPATPGLTPQPYYGTQTAPRASPVRHTSRNGSQLVHVDSDASFLSTLSHGERPSGLPPTTSVAGEPRGLARMSSRSGSDGPDRTISAPVRPGDFQQPVPAQSSPAVINQEAVATAANPQTAPANWSNWRSP